MDNAASHSNGAIAATAAGEADTDADPDPPERRNTRHGAGARHG